MEKTEFNAYTDENGIFHIQNQNRLMEWAKNYPNKQFLLTIGKRGSKRSTMQNRYYWGVCVEEVRLGLLNLGYELSKEETHYFLKERFNPTTIENKEGVTIDVAGSTTQMTKTQFAEYVEKIIRFAAEFLSIKIPAPNEHLEMKFE